MRSRPQLFVALAVFSASALAAQSRVPLEPRHQDPSNWSSYDRDNSGRRFSALDQIKPDNVDRLVVDWVYQFPQIPLRSEATPLVRDGVMYLTNGGADAMAVDARTGKLLWRYQRPTETESQPNWNRGFALSGNRLFMGTIDCRVIALDARSGALLWEAEVADEHPCFGITAAPLVVKNLVLTGSRGGDTGLLRGYLDAYDTETGARAWRYYTIPAPGEPGSETWPDTDVWKGGGGAPWTTGTYDPELDLLYVPTGNPGPLDFDGSNRPGDNLYTDSVLAIDPDGPSLKWHFQFTPHDEHDWDGNATPVLVDAEWEGQPRKLLLQANRNAFFYVLDRETGEFLLGEPYARQTWAEGLDADGRPILREGVSPSKLGSLVCPDIHGGANWHPVSYNPDAQLLYVSARDGCGKYYSTGHSIDHDLGDDVVQALRAIDIHTGKVAWEFPFLGETNKEINHSGSMTTAGNLVFFTSRIGQIIAADAHTGKALWNFNLGGSVRSGPITYAVNGKQYVAVVSKNAVFAFTLR